MKPDSIGTRHRGHTARVASLQRRSGSRRPEQPGAEEGDPARALQLITKGALATGGPWAVLVGRRIRQRRPRRHRAHHIFQQAQGDDRPSDPVPCGRDTFAAPIEAHRRQGGHGACPGPTPSCGLLIQSTANELAAQQTADLHGHRLKAGAARVTDRRGPGVERATGLTTRPRMNPGQGLDRHGDDVVWFPAVSSSKKALSAGR